MKSAMISPSDSRTQPGPGRTRAGEGHRVSVASAVMRRLALALWLCALLSPDDVFARNVPFGVQSVLPAGGDGADSASSADVDGDGDQDLVTSSFNDNTIAWFENLNGLGDTWSKHVISTTAMGAYWSFAVDLDRDGDIDVLSASFSDDRIVFYENNGASPPGWSAFVISSTADGARSVYAADVDGDGDIDVLSASLIDHKIVWYENTGSVRFGWLTHTISVAGVAARSVYAADVDGDGDMDVLGAFADSKQIDWYENQGGVPLVFSAHNITTTADGVQAVIAADLDDDGDMDVLSASNVDDTIAWYENDGLIPPTWTKRTITTTAFSAWDVRAADLDMDGDLDVVSASSADNKIAWYENDGASPPTWIPRTISTLAQSARSVVAADIDTDGDPDVISASFNDDKFAFYENLTIHRSAQFLEQRVVSTAVDYAWWVYAADIDGDGDLDTLSASAQDNKIAWYENLDGAGNFGPQHVITTSALSARSVFAADVDGDGDIDALSASVDDDKIAWYENLDGKGVLWSTHVISTVAGGAVKVIAADVDRDGDTDVLSASNYDSKIAWYENLNGSGTSWTEHVVSTLAAGAWDVKVADVDGDGDVDVLSASGADNRVTWYQNMDGVGVTWDVMDISTTVQYALSIAPADIDGDGDIDVVATSYTDAKVTWFENLNGAGTSWANHLIGTAPQGAWMSTVADLDNDGDLDVVSVFYPDHEVVWFQNLDGLGTFDPPSLIAYSLYLFGTTTGDIDGDGDQDVVTASGNDLVAWYPNSGGQFGLDTIDVVPASVVPPGATFPVLGVQVDHRGRPGDSNLEMSTLELLFEKNPGDPLTTAEANAVIENLYFYRDSNQNGTYDGSGVDALVATVGTLSLVAGLQTMTLPDGIPPLQVPANSSQLYFVVLQLTTNARKQPVNDFHVKTVTESSSTAEDTASDIRLNLQDVTNFTSGLICQPQFVSSVLPH